MIQNRRYERHQIKPRPYVAMNGSSFGGILYDVSAGGLSVDVVGPKPSSHRVLVDFDISETGEHFEAAGKIIWKSESSGRVGIQFIDLPESSHLKIKSWLSARSSFSEQHDAVALQHEDIEFVESSAWLKGYSSSPIASGPLEGQKSHMTPNYENSAQSGSVATLPEAPAPANAPAMYDSSAGDLQSRLSRIPAKKPEETSETANADVLRDRKRIVQWALTACVLLLATMLLAMGIKLSTSKNFDAGEAYQGLKTLASQNLSKLWNPSAPAAANPPMPAAIAPPLNPEVHPRESKPSHAKGIVDPGAKPVAPPADKFEVLDAQHGRRYFPRTSTSLVVQFEKSGAPPNFPDSAKTLVAPGSASTIYISRPNVYVDAAAADARNGAALGRVTRHSSGELPVTETMPDYPAYALEKNVQGRVVLTAIINTSGGMEDVQILSTPSLLDAAVLEAVKTWRYQPHVEDGKPVEAVTEIVVDFSITKHP